jgi:hypothetical protein
VNVPALAFATSSWMVLMPFDGAITVTFGMVPNGITAAKSRAGS